MRKQGLTCEIFLTGNPRGTGREQCPTTAHRRPGRTPGVQVFGLRNDEQVPDVGGEAREDRPSEEEVLPVRQV
jgi:hypothetical protein